MAGKGIVRRDVALGKLGREGRLVEVGGMLLRGYRPVEIAESLGVSVQQVYADIRMISAIWKESIRVDVGEMRVRELAKLDEVEREYWRAWEASCRSGRVVKTRRYRGDGEKVVGGEVREEVGAGDPRYLDGIARCIAQRCKILGIDQQTQLILNQANVIDVHGREHEIRRRLAKYEQVLEGGASEDTAQDIVDDGTGESVDTA